MSEYTIKIVNCDTGEEIVRDMNAKEIAMRKADEQEQINKLAAQETAATAKAALLTRLGITADEAALLLS